ncbi:hypothetical protein [Nonomuraea sp. LPB2021202275-12-8]|uniref:hypothetical protein n=1 Tax=Nonomuraea sp. LPB2021202275-12-8 TaxID=3120159 RepID=UPI00300D1299
MTDHRASFDAVITFGNGGALAAFDVRGRAVLLHTGAREGAPLTPAGAAWLVNRGAALVGTDADTLDGTAPAGGAPSARQALLDAGIVVVEGLGGLDRMPPAGALFSAVPPRGAGSRRVPVRAYGRVPGDS